MLSPAIRKKYSGFAKSLLPAFSAEMKKYEELYADFAVKGYSNELCERYADAFVNDIKKPAPEDIIQLAALYDRIHANTDAAYYLETLQDKKLSGEERFAYCLEMLKTESKLGHFRAAEDFRTENINFLQNHSKKRSSQELAEMYMALALVDVAGKHYNDAFKLLRFGYKPLGRNDSTLLEMLITGVYICARSGDQDGLQDAVTNTHSCLKLFSEYEFPWSKSYYEQRIEEAAQGIL